MPLYEHIFMARQDVTSQQVEAMVDQYKGVIEQNGGKVDKTEMWGVKSLAYRIKKNRKAHFTLFNIDAPAPAVAEMERQMRINEDILRFMTIRVEELETEPSVMMQKRDRDERKDRERRERDGGGFDAGARRGGIIMAFGTGGTAVALVRRRWRWRPSSVLPSSQDLPVLGPERAEDRLQGHEASVALHLRARQDRSFAHHGRVGQEAARARPGDQARPLPGPPALRDPLRLFGRAAVKRGPPLLLVARR